MLIPYFKIFKAILWRNKTSNTKEIERILSELSGLLYPIVYQIEKDIEVISKLDFINAKAKLAIEMEANLPIISNEINLIKARDPLIPKD